MNITLPTMLDELSSQDMVLGLFLVGIGLVFMIMGSRMFKSLVAISYGIIGFVLGGSLMTDDITRMVVGLVGAVAMALVSGYFVKSAVSVLAAGWTGGTVMLMCSSIMGFSDVTSLVLGAVVACAAISLTFISFNEVTAFTTSFEGSLLFMSGLVVFFSQNPGFWGPMRSILVQNILFGPLMILAATFIGFYFQLAELRTRNSGVSI